VNLAVAFACFCVGLYPLWVMFLFWRLARSPLSGLVFTYFLAQHIAFGLGGLLVALFDDGYQYVNLQGDFFYADALQRLMIVNAVALYAALAGVLSVGAGRSIFGVRSGSRVSVGKKDILMRTMEKHNKSLRRICFLSLGFHFIIVLFQWYITYQSINPNITYLVQVFAKVAPATFFFMGLLWPYERRDRKIFLIYILSYCILQLSTGGRAPALYAILMFSIGILYRSPSWFVQKRQVMLIAASLIILPWLAIQSENIRLVTQSRVPEGFKDLVQRLEMLTLDAQTTREDSWGKEYTPSLSNSLFRFGARIVEVSALDVFAKTPEEIPYWGWNDKDSTALGQQMLSTKFSRDDIVNGNDGTVMILREYGWAVDPSGGTSFPLTLLADSWRRFGWLGVIIIHYLWATLLTMIPIFLVWQRAKLLGIVMAGPTLYTFTFLYTSNLVDVLASLPRLLFISGVYAILLRSIIPIKIRLK